MASGGRRQPARPAAVSTPQSGARTDGGAGSKSQPLRVPTGGAYGEAGALTEQQQGAPLAAGGGSPVPTGGAGLGGKPAAGGGGAFGPTQRPNEPVTAGQPSQAAGGSDSLVVLRAMYDKYPSPYILSLLQ